MHALTRRWLTVGLVVVLLVGGVVPPRATALSAAEPVAVDGPAVDQVEAAVAAETAAGDRPESPDRQTANRSDRAGVRAGSADIAPITTRRHGDTAVARSVAATPASRDAAASDTAVAQTDGDEIRQTQTYARITEEPGRVAVRLTYEIPDRVVGLDTRVPDGATVTEADGFRRVNATAYEWDEETTRAVIRYRINPNRTVSKSGPEGADGRYVSVDAGEWALLTRSRTPTRWRYVGQDPVRFNRTVETAGPGAAGEELVYLGEVATFERTAHNQTIELVVPERTTMVSSPIAVLDSLTNASNALRIGDRDERVFVVAAPSTAVPWGVAGFQLGDSDMWIQSDRRLSSANNVWLHEYVHTRQSFTPTRETRWLTEGMATYYAAALTLEQDRIDFASFRSRLSLGTRSVYDDVALADPDSWTANANYNKGGLAAGQIDRRIRAETGRNRTFQNVARGLNGRQEPVTQAQLLAEVEAAGGAPARNDTVRYTETTAATPVWNQTTHQRLFGEIPARIGYSLPPVDQRDAYRAGGPYRPGAPVGGSEPIRLVTGETLVVDVVVENAGGAAGAYNASLAVNGTAVAAEQGQLAAGERVVVPLSHTFTDPGRYEVSVDGERVTVVVTDPGQATVTEVAVSSLTVRQGESVTVTATVANDGDVPAAATVVFTQNETAVAQHQVSLAPRTTTRVTQPVTLSRPGTVSLSAGNGRDAGPSVDVTVTPATAEPTRTPAPTTTVERTTNGRGDGFTVALALLAVAAAALLARRR
ncbi:peptidase [Haloarcula salina]|uniref:peptidase n=1 Tax=Haloarcula salina TaxID=1429914 RepID=UPI003C6FC3AF